MPSVARPGGAPSGWPECTRTTMVSTNSWPCPLFLLVGYLSPGHGASPHHRARWKPTHMPHQSRLQGLELDIRRPRPPPATLKHALEPPSRSITLVVSRWLRSPHVPTTHCLPLVELKRVQAEPPPLVHAERGLVLVSREVGEGAFFFYIGSCIRGLPVWVYKKNWRLFCPATPNLLSNRAPFIKKINWHVWSQLLFGTPQWRCSKAATVPHHARGETARRKPTGLAPARRTTTGTMDIIDTLVS
jgi:hypothetical protein